MSPGKLANPTKFMRNGQPW